MLCPRCKIELTTDSLKDVKTSIEIDTCINCAGIWFDKGELDSIENIMEPTLIEFRNIPSKKNQLEPLYCPSCSNHPHLEKAEHPRDSKVIFDYCPTCKGIWLDHNELKAIQQENWLITIGKIFKWLIGKE